MSKKALLLCGTHNDLGLIRALKKLGFYIVVTGNISGLPGEGLCDKFIKADYSDKERILEIAKEEEVDAVVQCCNDFGVYTAAYVAEKLGLPGYDSYEITSLLHNKDLFKKFALENNLLVIPSNGFDEEEKALEYIKKADYPIIVKPVDASAGNGVSKAISYEEGVEAVKFAFEKSKSKRIVIEPFIEGTQHGFCTFLIDKKVVAVCSNDEYSFENPFRVEIDTFPAKCDEAVSSTLVSQIELIAEKLDLCDGIFHLQFLLDSNGPHIIEVMRRVLGNMYHVPGNLSCGMDLEYWETRARCGLSLKDFPANVAQEGYFAYKTILAPYNGTIERIEVSSKFKPYLLGSYFLKQEGDEIANYLSTPVGFLFLQFRTQEDMLRVLKDEYINNLVSMVGKN